MYDIRNLYAFIRKTVPSYFSIEVEDFWNEVRAVLKLGLSKADSHKNLVKVLAYGSLFDLDHYYLDMEIWDTTLEQFMKTPLPERYGLAILKRLINSKDTLRLRSHGKFRVNLQVD